MPLLHISHQQQRRQADCLAACAMMVLQYLHIQVNYETLLKMLHIGPAGAPYRNLQHLKNLGVSVLIENGNLNILRNHLSHNLLPIVFVSTDGLPYWNELPTHHAIVVTGIQNDQVYLHDPNFAEAPQVVSALEFNFAWSEMDEVYALLQRS